MKNRFTILFLIIIASIVTFLSRSVFAGEPSAQALIEKARMAMNATMKYKVDASGGNTTTVIYQKTLTNGLTVSRNETASETIKLIYLFLNDGTFQLFPDAHAAIDITSLEQVGLVPSVNPFTKISAETGELKGYDKFNNQVCYKVKAHLAPMNTNLIAILPASAPLPDACRYLIETNTYRVLQMTMLQGASTYGSIQFKDFEALPDLPDMYYAIPKDYKIERADSLKEYTRLMMKYFNNGPKKIPKGFAFDRDNQRIVKVDPKTGAYIALDTNIVESTVDKIAKSKAQNRIRILMFFVLVISSLGFLILIVKSQRRQNKSN